MFVDPILEDPEVKAIRYEFEPIEAEREAEYFTPVVLSEFEEFFSWCCFSSLRVNGAGARSGR